MLDGPEETRDVKNYVHFSCCYQDRKQFLQPKPHLNFISTTLNFEQSSQTSSTLEDQKQQKMMVLHKDDNENVRKVCNSRKKLLKEKERAGHRNHREERKHQSEETF